MRNLKNKIHKQKFSEAEKKKSFSGKLLRWHKKNGRTFPWKETNDVYKIWLSEIILQQTRVEQGLPYYLKFIELFPTVQHLSAASEEKVMKAWQGLGYYSRARNLHLASKYIANELNGVFPNNYEGWLKVKGVGAYTAAAISSFAFNLPHAVVDGNVYRALSRYFGIKTPIDSSGGKKIFSSLANELLDKKNAAAFNQAIMDFGATLCKPVSPDCDRCPFNTDCISLKKNLIDFLPVKEKKTKITERFFHFFIVKTAKGFLFEKRNGNDIWKGLNQFPVIEREKFLSDSELKKTPEYKNIFTENKISLTRSKEFHQLLTHQIIRARFYQTEISTYSGNKFLVVSKSQLMNRAVPKLIDQYLKTVYLVALKKQTP